MALCECGCGETTSIAAKTSARAGTKKGEPLRFVNGHNSRLPRRHGHGGQGAKRSSAYNTWASMKTRCSNSNQQTWAQYGGRGIVVCEGWEDFAEFYADMGDRPQGKSIDRIDGAGNYSCGHCDQCVREGWPMNCRWATWSEQMFNRAPYKHTKKRQRRPSRIAQSE